MKYIVLTFDDGRNDNYNYAYPIMKKYGIQGTVYCTTGFIDKTWTKKEDWYSAEQGLTINQMCELKENGWEIAIHGDKHITEINDTAIAIDKMKKWGLYDHSIGCSLPDSIIDSKTFGNYVDTFCPKDISYVRKGMSIDTSKVKNKILFVFSYLLGFQCAYNKFNKDNVFVFDKLERTAIPSVVVRFRDNPKTILKFVDELPNNTCVVFMLHSILPKGSPFFGLDRWNWDVVKFDKLCNGLKERTDNGKIKVLTLEKLINKEVSYGKN